MIVVYYFVWVTVRIVTKLLFRIRVRGMEHIPKNGGFILATNHVSYFDPPLIGSWSPRTLHYFAKEELFRNRLFGWILRGVFALPVRRGAIDRKAIGNCVAAIEEGSGLLLFPEGTRSKTGEFLPPKPGIGMIATRAGCAIVPGYVHGSNRLWDSLLGRIRFSITYGEAIPTEKIATYQSGKDNYREITDMVMVRIRALRDEVVGVKAETASSD